MGRNIVLPLCYQDIGRKKGRKRVRGRKRKSGRRVWRGIEREVFRVSKIGIINSF